jgi:hypothetical protein
MLILAFAVAGVLSPPVVDPGFVHQAQRACAGSVTQQPKLPGIKVERLAAAAGDLAKLRITDQQSGGWLLAYYDASGERAAYARAACLGAQLRLLALELGDMPPQQQWFSAVFTTDSHYIAPPGETVNRWKIPLEADGSLGPQGQSMIVLTMPHEQVHRFQMRAGADVPRWMEEGHAEWISRKIRRQIAPTAAKEDEDRFRQWFDRATQPVSLENWGAMRVTREAIMRQVPPEERRKMQDDPTYTAPLSGRSFSIGPGDMVSDESNLKARYEASWRLFRDLEATHGQAAVERWVAGLTSRPGRVDGTTTLRSANEVLHEDLGEKLG